MVFVLGHDDDAVVKKYPISGIKTDPQYMVGKQAATFVCACELWFVGLGH